MSILMQRTPKEIEYELPIAYQRVGSGNYYFIAHSICPGKSGFKFVSNYLTHFMPLGSFYTPGKYQKTRGFLMFSGGIETDQWHEMG